MSGPDVLAAKARGPIARLTAKGLAYEAELHRRKAPLGRVMVADRAFHEEAMKSGREFPRIVKPWIGSQDGFCPNDYEPALDHLQLWRDILGTHALFMFISAQDQSYWNRVLILSEKYGGQNAIRAIIIHGWNLDIKDEFLDGLKKLIHSEPKLERIVLDVKSFHKYTEQHAYAYAELLAKKIAIPIIVDTCGVQL